MDQFGQYNYSPYSRFRDSGSDYSARSFRDYGREYSDPRNLRGRVVHVEDADTISVRLSSGQVRTIRFANIDAPEVAHRPGDISQRGGEEAKRRLQELLPLGSQVSVRDIGSDASGLRRMGEVYTPQSYINLQLVREGHAHADNFGYQLDQSYQSYDFAVASRQAYREERPISRATESPSSWRDYLKYGTPLERPERYTSDKYSSGEFGFIYKTGYKAYSGAVPQYTNSVRAAKPLMPTKLSEGYFDRYIGRELPTYSSYTETYEAITEQQAPAEAVQMDKAISTPSLGHQLNRLLGFKFYTEGKGILGSIAVGLGRTVDTLLGQKEFEADQLERSGKLQGGVRKFAALPYKDYQSEPGLFEKVAGASFEAAAGFSVAVFGYGLALTTQFTASALFARGVEHLASLEAERTTLQKLITPSAFMGGNERKIDRLAQEIYRQAQLEGKAISFQTALFQAERQLFPSGSGRAPGTAQNDLFTLTGFISAQRRFESSVISQFGHSLLDVVVPEFNRSDARKSLNKLIKTLEAPIRFSASEGRVLNYGTERVKEVAREIDSITHYVPANLLYWVPQVREFAGVKDIQDHSIAKVYGEGLLTKVIQSFITTAKISADLIAKPNETLKTARELYQTGRDLYTMESRLAQHLRSKVVQGSSAIEDELKTLNSVGAGLYQTYLEQTERLNTKIQTYRGVNSFLSADPTAPLTKSQEKNRSNLQTLLLIGGVLAADYTADQFILRTQGATLHDQISLFRAVQGPNGAVVRYEFNATMPVGVSLTAAATFGAAAGYLFPTVKTIAPSAQVLGRTLQGFTESKSLSAAARSMAAELLEVQGHRAVPFSNRVRFNKTAAAIGAALGLMGTKVAYVAAAGLMNSIYNREPGVKLDAERDLTAGYLLKALNRTRSVVDSPNVTVGDLATREVLKNLVEGYKTSSVQFSSGQGFYSIAQQFSLGFVQFATLARADQRTGLTTYSFGFQVLPTLGIGFTPTLPFGLKRETGEEKLPPGSWYNPLGIAAYSTGKTLSELTLLNSLGYMPGSMFETGAMAVGAYSLLGTIGSSVLRNARAAAPGTIRANTLSYLSREFADARPLLNALAGGAKFARSAGLGIYGLSFAMPHVIGSSAARFLDGTDLQLKVDALTQTKGAAALGNTLRRATPFYLAAAAGMALTDPIAGIEIDEREGLFNDPITRAVGVASVAGVYGGGMATLGVFDSQEKMAASLLRRNRLAELLPGVQNFRREIASAETTALRRGGARAGVLFSLLAATKFGSMLASRAVGQIGGEEALQNLYKVAPILRIAGGVKASEYRMEGRNFLLDSASDLLETLTFGGFKLTEALGLYKDDPNMFLPAFGFPFGISFREDGSIRSYTQLASPTADISYSVYGLFKPQMSKDLVLKMDAIRQIDPRQLESDQAANVIYAMARGAVGRYKPAKLVDFTGYEISALQSSGLQRAFSRRKFLLTNIAFQRPSELSMDLSRGGVLYGKIGLRGNEQKIPFMGIAPLDGLDLDFLPFYKGKAAGATEDDLYKYMRQQATTRDRSVYLPKPFQQARDLTQAFAGYGDPTASSLVMGGLSVGLALGSLVASTFTAVQLAAAVESSILGKTGREAVLGLHNLASQADFYARHFSYETLVEDGQAYITQSMTGGRRAVGRVNIEDGVDPEQFTKAVQRGFRNIGSNVRGYLARPVSLIKGEIGGSSLNLIDEVIRLAETPDAARQRLVTEAFATSYQSELYPLLKKRIAGKSLFERFFYPQVANRFAGSLEPDAYIGNYLDEVISPGAYSPLFEKAKELQRTGRLGNRSTRDTLNQLRAEIELKAYKQRLTQATPYRFSPNDLEQLEEKLGGVTQIDLSTPVGIRPQTLYGSLTGGMRGVGSLAAKYAFYIQPFYGMAEGAAFMMSADERQRRMGARAFVQGAGYQLTSIALAKAVGSAFKLNPLASLIASGIGLAAYDTLLTNTGIGRGIKGVESAVGGLVSNVLAGVAGLLSPLTAPLGGLLREGIFQPLGDRIYSAYNQAGQSSMAAVMLAEFLLPQSIYKTGEQYRARRTAVGTEPFVFGDARGYYRDQNFSGLVDTMSLNPDISSSISSKFVLGKVSGYRERMLYENFFSLSPSGRITESPLANFSIQSMYSLSETTRLALERRQDLYAYSRYGSAMRRADRGEDYTSANLVATAFSNLDRKAIDLGIPVGTLLSEELKSIRAGLTFGGAAYQQLAKAFPNQEFLGARRIALGSGVLGRLRRGVGLIDRATGSVGSFLGRTGRAVSRPFVLIAGAAERNIGRPFIRGITSGLTTFRSNVLEPMAVGVRRAGAEMLSGSSQILSGLVDDFAPLAARIAVGTLYALKTIGSYGIDSVAKYGNKLISPLANRVNLAPPAVAVPTEIPMAAATEVVEQSTTLGRAFNNIVGFSSRQVKSLARETRLASPVLLDAANLLPGIARVNLIDTKYSTGYAASSAYSNQAGLSFGVMAGSLATVLGYSILPTIAISLAASLVGERIGMGMAMGDMLRDEEKNKQKLQLLTGLALATSVGSNLYSRSRASLLDATRVELAEEKGQLRSRMSIARRTRNDLRYQPQGSIRRRAAQFEVFHESVHARQARAGSSLDSFVTLQDHLSLRGELIKRVGRSRSGDVLNTLDRLAQRSTQQVLFGLGDNLTNFTQEDYQRIYEQEFEANARAFLYQRNRVGQAKAIDVLSYIDRRQSKGRFEGRVRADGKFVGTFDRLGANAYAAQEGVSADSLEGYSVQERIGVEPGLRYAGGGLRKRIRDFRNVGFKSFLNPLVEVVNSRAGNPEEKIANHAEVGAAELRYSTRVRPLELLGRVGDATQLLLLSQNALDYATFPGTRMGAKERKARATQIAMANVGLVQGSILQLAATGAGLSVQSRLASFAAGLILPQLGLDLSFGLGSNYAYAQGQWAEESGDLMPGVSSAALTRLSAPGVEKDLAAVFTRARPLAGALRQSIRSRFVAAAGDRAVSEYLIRQSVKRTALGIGGYAAGSYLSGKVFGEDNRINNLAGWAGAIATQLPFGAIGRRLPRAGLPNLIQLSQLAGNLAGLSYSRTAATTVSETEKASYLSRLRLPRFSVSIQRPTVSLTRLRRAGRYLYDVPGRVSDRLFSISQRFNLERMPGRYASVAIGATLGTYYLQDDYRKDIAGAAGVGLATTAIMAAPHLSTYVLNKTIRSRVQIAGLLPAVRAEAARLADLTPGAKSNIAGLLPAARSQPGKIQSLLNRVGGRASSFSRNAAQAVGELTAAGGLMFAGYVIGDIFDQNNEPGSIPMGGVAGAGALGFTYLMTRSGRGVSRFSSLGRYGTYGALGAAAGLIIGGTVGADSDRSSKVGLGIGLTLAYLAGDRKVRSNKLRLIGSRFLRGAERGGIRQGTLAYIQRKGGFASAAFRGAEIGFAALDVYGAYSSAALARGDTGRTQAAVARSYQAQTSVAIAFGLRGSLVGGLVGLAASPITNFIAEQRGRYLTQAGASDQDLLVETTGDLVGSVRTGLFLRAMGGLVATSATAQRSRVGRFAANYLFGLPSTKDASATTEAFDKLQRLDNRLAQRAEAAEKLRLARLEQQRGLAQEVLSGRVTTGAMSRAEALKIVNQSNALLPLSSLREFSGGLGRASGKLLDSGLRTASRVSSAIRGTRAAAKAGEAIESAKLVSKRLKVVPILGLAGTVIDLGVGGYNLVTGLSDAKRIAMGEDSENLAATQRAGEKVFGGAGRILGTVAGGAVGEVLKVAGGTFGATMGWTGAGAVAGAAIYSLGVATQIFGAEIGEFVFGKVGQAVGTAAWAVRNPQRAAGAIRRNLGELYRSTAEFLGFNVGLNVGEVYTPGMNVDSLYAQPQPSYARREQSTPGQRVVSSNVTESRVAPTGLYGRAEFLTAERMVTEVAQGSESQIERARRARLLENRILGRDRIRPYVSPSQAGYYGGGSGGVPGSVTGQYGTYNGPVGVTSGESTGQRRPMTPREGLESVFTRAQVPTSTGTYTSGEGDRMRISGDMYEGSSYNYRERIFGSAYGEVEIVPGTGVVVTSGYGGRNVSQGRTFHPGVDIARGDGGLMQVNPFASARVIDAGGDRVTLAELTQEGMETGRRVRFYHTDQQYGVQGGQVIPFGTQVGNEGTSGGLYPMHSHIEYFLTTPGTIDGLATGDGSLAGVPDEHYFAPTREEIIATTGLSRNPLGRLREVAPGQFVTDSSSSPRTNKQSFEYGRSTGQETGNRFRTEGRIEMNFNLGAAVHFLNLNRQQQGVDQLYSPGRSFDATQFLSEIEHVRGNKFSDEQRAQLQADIREHNRLVSEGFSIQYPQAQLETNAPAPPGQTGSFYSGPRTTGSQVRLSEAEFYQLATLANLEATTRQGAVDVSQAIFNRLNSGNYGSSLTDIMFAPGQFEPYFGHSPDQIRDEASAVSFLQSRGYSADLARRTIREFREDVQDPSKMADARQFVGGRTGFKGVTMYPYRVPGEDPLRQEGENFFHIEGSQTYDQLRRYASMGPLQVLINSESNTSVYNAGEAVAGGQPQQRSDGFNYQNPIQGLINSARNIISGLMPSQPAGKDSLFSGGSVAYGGGVLGGFAPSSRDPLVHLGADQQKSIASIFPRAQAQAGGLVTTTLRTLVTLGTETPRPQSAGAQNKVPVSQQSIPLPPIPEFKNARDLIPLIKMAPGAIATLFDEVVKEYEKATEQIKAIAEQIAGVPEPQRRTARIEIYERVPRVATQPAANYTGDSGKSVGKTPRASAEYSGGANDWSAGYGGGGTYTSGYSSSGGSWGYDPGVGQAVREQVAPSFSAGIGAGLSVGISEGRDSGDDNRRANTGSSSFEPSRPPGYRHYGL